MESRTKNKKTREQIEGMATEVAAMRLVRQNPAVPVPEIYFFDEAHDLCDADYFFMEKIEGDNLEHVKGSLTAETVAAVEARIGEIVREVNGFSGVYGESFNNYIRGYGKSSFTFAEEQRNHLYSLHLALVMHTECFYRHYDSNDIFNLSRRFIRETMEWLKAN